MFKCFFTKIFPKTNIKENFFKNNHFLFSQKFYEKRMKMKSFLSKDKEKYKIEMLNREYILKEFEEERISNKKRKSEKTADDKKELKKQERMNKIRRNSCVNFAYLYINNNFNLEKIIHIYFLTKK
jgi:hypothetical protein